MGHVMTKPLYAICEQQRRRSAWASAQSDQRLCCSLPGWYSTSTCYSRNFKTLANLYSGAGRFESCLVANLEDRFSRDVAQMGPWQTTQIDQKLRLIRGYTVYLQEFEPWHDKTNKVTVRPAKTQIRPVWSESSLSAWRKLWSLATH